MGVEGNSNDMYDSAFTYSVFMWRMDLRAGGMVSRDTTNSEAETLSLVGVDSHAVIRPSMADEESGGDARDMDMCKAIGQPGHICQDADLAMEHQAVASSEVLEDRSGSAGDKVDIADAASQEQSLPQGVAAAGIGPAGDASRARAESSDVRVVEAAKIASAAAEARPGPARATSLDAVRDALWASAPTAQIWTASGGQTDLGPLASHVEETQQDPDDVACSRQDETPGREEAVAGATDVVAAAVGASLAPPKEPRPRKRAPRAPPVQEPVCDMDIITLPRLGPNGVVDSEGGMVEVCVQVVGRFE